MYEYKATVVSVYDGDTITVDIDLGFNSWQRGVKIRLFGIDAPEVRGVERPEGLISRDWLREHILDTEIILKTRKDKKGKYGRWLGDIYSDENDMISFNTELVQEHMAEAANY